ncbi:MAG: hypothetical protein QOH26_71, partial [Actinomycetota bacterium]|nr:hypothetical protein [Actinomycetota bacterium]
FVPSGAAIALKLMGAVHRLVLEGRAPELGEFYPSVGGTFDPPRGWTAFRATLDQKREELPPLIERPVQTNEVGRCGGLVGGFLEVARAFGHPLRLLEIGASGGLNLRWDHYRYETAGASWGPPDSPVQLRDFEGESPPFDVRVTVSERRGCDPNPVDPVSDEGRLTLSSYVWPDQDWRWRALRGAFRVAERVPATVERAGAFEWLERQLAEPKDGVATVVYHSIVMQYLTDEERTKVRALIDETGKAATDRSPLAWLRMEPPEEDFEAIEEELASVHLTMWPTGETMLIARCGYHGRPVRWLGTSLYDSRR